ncbi:MAG: universal stress protein, partial [Burkholderiaceae bacterium]
MKILLPVDGSAYTKKMLAYLTTHAELFGAGNTFTLLSVQEPLPPRARAAVGADIAQGFYADESQKVTAPVVKFLERHGLAVKVIHKVGSAGDIIAKTATA